MAIAATTLWELNASATSGNVNGGAFNYANANFITDYTATSATGNAPVLSSATYTFVAGDVNAWVYVQSGTNWTPGFYKIASVAGGAATLNATIGQALQLVAGNWIPNTVAGIATVASPTGGVVGIDYSRGTAAIATATDLACADGDEAAPEVTSAAAPFGLNHVGNVMHVTAGTGYTATWFEIVSVSGSTATLDKAVGADGALADGTFYVGGALSLPTDAALEMGIAGNIFFVKQGTYTMAAGFNLTAAGTTTKPILVMGYASLRGDRPTGSTRPLIAMGSNLAQPNNNWDWSYLTFTGDGSSVFEAYFANKVSHCKIINNSTTADRNAISISTDTMLYNCEAISYRGYGIRIVSFNSNILNCYVHDSKVGIFCSGTDNVTSIINTVVESCVTAAIQYSGAQTASQIINGCTLYGSENTTGVGISLAAGCTDIRVMNTIIYGFVTGVSHGTAGQTVGYDNYNCYFNNDTNASNWTLGVNSVAVDPEFVNVTQETGTTGTTASSILTDATANFAAVVDNQDFCYLVSGTGVTAGQYLITAHTATSVTLSPAPGNDATADKVYQVTMGRNFQVEGAVIGAAAPSPSSLFENFMDIGAVQSEFGEGIDPATAGGSTGSKRLGGVRGF